MDMQRCTLFWRYFCQTYFILLNPPYWFSNVDLALIINIGFSGTHPLDRSTKYFSVALSVMELFLWRVWRTGVYLGLLVWFGCILCDIGVWLCSFSAWNLRTETTAPVSTYCSDPFSRMGSPSESNPSAVVNPEKLSMPNHASSQGRILPVIFHIGFLYMSLAQHITLSAQLFPVCTWYVWPPFSNAQSGWGISGIWFLFIISIYGYLYQMFI